MHKTLEFAINEALESGRRSAMPQFFEMEMREKIAQEIEHKTMHISSSDIVKMVAWEVAQFVRSKK